MTHNNTNRVQFLKTIGALGQEQAICDLLKSIKNPNTEAEVVSLNAYPKLTNLEFLTYESLMSTDILRLVRQNSLAGVDAMVIGCFFDPILDAAREISGETIVVGPCESSVQLATNLCNRFSIIVGQQKWAEHLGQLVHRYGHSQSLASIRSIDIPVDQLQADYLYTKNQILAVGRRAIEQDRAEALILGCTCTYGLFSEIQLELGVPVIDPVYASFKAAEYLAECKQQFGWSPSSVWSCEAPSEADIEKFEIFKEPPAIKDRIRIS